jgi:hypothetical protein
MSAYPRSSAARGRRCGQPVSGSKMIAGSSGRRFRARRAVVGPSLQVASPPTPKLWIRGRRNRQPLDQTAGARPSPPQAVEGDAGSDRLRTGADAAAVTVALAALEWRGAVVAGATVVAELDESVAARPLARVAAMRDRGTLTRRTVAQAGAAATRTGDLDVAGVARRGGLGGAAGALPVPAAVSVLVGIRGVEDAETRIGQTAGAELTDGQDLAVAGVAPRREGLERAARSLPGGATVAVLVRSGGPRGRRAEGDERQNGDRRDGRGVRASGPSRSPGPDCCSIHFPLLGGPGFARVTRAEEGSRLSLRSPHRAGLMLAIAPRL